EADGSRARRKDRARRAGPAAPRRRLEDRRRRRGCPMKVAMLRVTSILKVGLRAILRNKLRSSLTMLGIIIGVGCVITVIAVASAASASVQAQISSLGANFIFIFPGATTQSGARIFTGQSTLTVDDAEALKECPSVAYSSPGVRANAQVVAGELNWGTQI